MNILFCASTKKRKWEEERGEKKEKVGENLCKKEDGKERNRRKNNVRVRKEREIGREK